MSVPILLTLDSGVKLRRARRDDGFATVHRFPVHFFDGTTRERTLRQRVIHIRLDGVFYFGYYKGYTELFRTEDGVRDEKTVTLKQVGVERYAIIPLNVYNELLLKLEDERPYLFDLLRGKSINMFHQHAHFNDEIDAIAFKRQHEDYYCTYDYPELYGRLGDEIDIYPNRYTAVFQSEESARIFHRLYPHWEARYITAIKPSVMPADVIAHRQGREKYQ